MTRIRYINDRRFDHPVPVEESKSTIGWTLGLLMAIVFAGTCLVGYTLAKPIYEVNQALAHVNNF